MKLRQQLFPEKLSEGERRILAAAATTLIPGKAGMPAAEKVVPVSAPVANYLDKLPPRQLRRIRLVLRIFEFSPIVSGHIKPFSKLSESARIAHLAKLETSRVSVKRDLLIFVKVLSSLGYGRDPVVQEQIGYSSTCSLPKKSNKLPQAAPRLEPDDLAPLSADIEVDAVIVGSGAGGAVAAYELAKSGRSVVVLEEGSYYDKRSFSTDPLQALPSLYRDQGLTLLEGRPAIPIPVGRCVGGTTVINSGTCFRAPKEVLEKWRKQYDVEWATAEVLDPIYAQLEHDLLIEPVNLKSMGNNGRLCMEGAAALGASGGPISRYANGCTQCSSCPTGCQIDAKQATHISYMPRAVAAGAELYVRTRVDRVLVEGKRAIGLKVTTLGNSDREAKTHKIKAGIVVLAAGALGTPELLIRSGLDKTHEQVGRNLRVHPACWIGGLYDEDVRGWEGIMQSYYVDQWHDQGLLLEATFTPLSFAGHWLPGVGEQFERRLANFGKIGSIGVHLSDHSRGRVKLNRRGHSTLSYRLLPADVRKLVTGIAHAADIHFAAGAREVYPHVGSITRLLPGEQSGLGSNSFKAHELRLEAFHPMGTARLGHNREDSVVRSDGQVHGVSGLYVADASLFPTSLGANPMLTIMAFATQIARELG